MYPYSQSLYKYRGNFTFNPSQKKYSRRTLRENLCPCLCRWVIVNIELLLVLRYRIDTDTSTSTEFQYGLILSTDVCYSIFESIRYLNKWLVIIIIIFPFLTWFLCIMLSWFSLYWIPSGRHMNLPIMGKILLYKYNNFHLLSTVSTPLLLL